MLNGLREMSGIKTKKAANKFIENWRVTWESLDPYAFISKHSINFNSEKHDFEKRVAHILRIIKKKHTLKLKLKI